MMPLGDDNQGVRTFPFVTYALIAINVIVFLVEVSMGSGIDAFLQRWAVQNNEIRAGQDLYTLLTSTFLHAGWGHLLSNMLYLWIFGDNVEDALGHLPYLVFYLLGGIVAGLTNVFLTGPSDIVSLGASGAIGAVLGAYLVMFPNARVRVAGTGRSMGYTPALVMIGLWAAYQFIGGIMSIGATTGGVGYWAHIGGFVFGAIAGFFLRSRGRSQVSTAQSR